MILRICREDRDFSDKTSYKVILLLFAVTNTGR